MSKLFSNILTKLKPSETGVTLQRDHLTKKKPSEKVIKLQQQFINDYKVYLLNKEVDQMVFKKDEYETLKKIAEIIGVKVKKWRK